jgi:hypothetical protein
VPDQLSFGREVLLAMLGGHTCPICYQGKLAGVPFCGPCMFNLPEIVRRPLVHGVDEAFPESFEAAARLLCKRRNLDWDKFLTRFLESLPL